MARLNSKKHKERMDRLERMADGTAQHSKEPKFPVTVDEAELRTRKENLDNARTDYEAKQRAADLAFDEYENQALQTDETIAKNDNALRGFYSKNNPILADFGVSIPKARASAKRSGSSSSKSK